jgi:hypothetical protein
MFAMFSLPLASDAFVQTPDVERVAGEPEPEDW